MRSPGIPRGEKDRESAGRQSANANFFSITAVPSKFYMRHTSLTAGGMRINSDERDYGGARGEGGCGTRAGNHGLELTCGTASD